MAIFRDLQHMKSTKRVAPRQNIENLGQESAIKVDTPRSAALWTHLDIFLAGP